MTENMSALIAGSFIDCGDVQDIDSLLLEWTADSGIPVISGIPLGHGPENITLPVGVNARFDTSELLLKYRDGYIE
jgi:muramoyltetrapeptide carboxypeptidase